jgi:arsenite-transporting ATPase
MEIDPDEATREYKEKIIGPFRDIMPEDVLASINEQLSGPCTTEMASFDRFIDFMETDDYDVIVFDTAPTGHTIRLLELPVDWSKHIEESSKGSGQTCLGPVQTIQDSKDKYDRATSLLKDTERTSVIFVMRPEELSLYETLRASKELETIGVKSGELIINGMLPEEVCEIEFFKKKYEAQQKVITLTEEAIKKPKRYMFLRDNEVKGIDLTDVGRSCLMKTSFFRSPSRHITSSGGSQWKTGLIISGFPGTEQRRYSLRVKAGSEKPPYLAFQHSIFQKRDIRHFL